MPNTTEGLRGRPLYRSIAILLAAVAMQACHDESSPTSPPAFAVHGAEDEGGRRGGKAVRTPFRLRGFTTIESLAPHPRCGAPPRFLNVQVGEGRATHLGRFTMRIEFCVDATDLLDDGRLSEGESLPYDDGLGTLIAANGDELHITVSGAVLPSSDPAYDFQFQDPFVFVGGTGRFAGATGGGRTDSKVTQEPERTDHVWRGRLVLRRGR